MKISLLNNDLNEISYIDGDDENNRWSEVVSNEVVLLK